MQETDARPTERDYWLALTRVVGIGPARFQRLIAQFGSAERAWKADGIALLRAGLDERSAQALLALRRRVDPAGEERRLAALGASALTLEDEHYPASLRTIADPPPVLFVRGTLQPTDEWAVAIVGTRRATPYGRQVAEYLATALARAGITVVSGLARGIDACAHRAALAAGGRTIAVLAHGLDTVYPPEHAPLAREIVASGALVTEFPLGTRPDAANFPRRNRILAGLARATVVVEAGLSSGALITANQALEQGREVFAVPGSIFSPASQGTNALIKEGARPVTDPNDLLEELHLTLSLERQALREVLPADPTEAAILTQLGDSPLHIDEVSRAAGLPVATVSSTLALLELKGLVRQAGPLSYVRVRR
ncbi:MAG TPA: DNA-processing protein DprA [Chloroflexota bacterium]|nr:DNA-processing protein DprA [Chloroflexota bacterium]HZU04398.1 DNA-processing protein DprA [Chloroflexota bacterium]